MKGHSTMIKILFYLLILLSILPYHSSHSRTSRKVKKILKLLKSSHPQHKKQGLKYLQAKSYLLRPLFRLLRKEKPSTQIDIFDTLKKLNIKGKVIIPDLRRYLNNSNPIIVLRTIELLGKIDKKVNRYFPFMLSILNQKNKHFISVNQKMRSYLRAAAAEIIGKMGKIGHKAIPILLTAIQGSDWRVSEKAARALGMLKNLGQYNKRSVQVLQKSLSINEVGLREAASYALGELGSNAFIAEPKLKQRLLDWNGRVRQAALKSLLKLKLINISYKFQLLKMLALKNTTKIEKKIILITLKKLLPNNALFPFLAKTTTNKSKTLQKASTFILRKQFKLSFPFFIKALLDNKKIRHHYNHVALVKIGKLGVPKLLKQLHNKSLKRPEVIIDVLKDIGIEAHLAILPLTRKFAGASSKLHKSLVNALSRISKNNIYILSQTLLHKNKEIRRGVLDTLFKIKQRPTGAGHALVQFFLDDKKLYRKKALILLMMLGNKGKKALINGLLSKKAIIRKRSKVIIHSLGAKAIPSLVQALGSLSMRKRRIVAKTLTGLRHTAFPYLIRMFGSHSSRTRRTAAILIANQQNAVIPILIKVLNVHSATRREAAAYALGNMGKKAKRAIPILRILSKNDPVWNVRHAASIALGKIKRR